MWPFGNKQKSPTVPSVEFPSELLSALHEVSDRLGKLDLSIRENSTELAALQESIQVFSAKLDVSNNQVGNLYAKIAQMRPEIGKEIHIPSPADLAPTIPPVNLSELEKPKIQNLEQAIAESYVQACHQQVKGAADISRFLRILSEFRNRFAYQEYAVYRSGTERSAKWSRQKVFNPREWRAIDDDNQIYLIPESQINGEFSDGNADLAYDIDGPTPTVGRIGLFRPAVVKPDGSYLVLVCRGAIQIR